MSGCRWSDKVERWFDGETTPQTAAEVSSHIARCPECARQAAFLKQMRNGMAAVSRPEIGDAQFAAFMAGVREGVQAPRRSWGRFWTLASVTAAALIAAVSTFIIISEEPKTVDATVVESVTTELEGATVETYEDAGGDTTIAVTMSKDDIW